MRIRPERPGDIPAIRATTAAAFAGVPYASGTEAAIVDALREAGALSLSLVAVQDDGEVVGHVAFSPVAIGGASAGWYGLGPVSVRPSRQGMGVGRSLIVKGLARLKASGARGCVLVGDPRYYARFGFVSEPGLTCAGIPAEYVQRLVFEGAPPRGEIAYHAGFNAA